MSLSCGLVFVLAFVLHVIVMYLFCTKLKSYTTLVKQKVQNTPCLSLVAWSLYGI
jgi:hypothetical protein